LLGGLIEKGSSPELVIVSDGPGQCAIIVLHADGSEGDIRGHARWRKISGGTRSDLGKRCRDGFASLKKTCRKLGVSFWDYLRDRIGRSRHCPTSSANAPQRRSQGPEFLRSYLEYAGPSLARTGSVGFFSAPLTQT
jgi:hypothetical protein